MKGVLWLSAKNRETVVAQGRFQSLKIFQLKLSLQDGKEDFQSAVYLVELADFHISHEGFCRGKLKKELLR